MAGGRAAMAGRVYSVAVMRFAIVLAGVAIAAVAVFSGLDRASLAQPSLGSHVPAAFAAQARLVSARQLLERQDFPGARDAALLALRAAPVEPESPALLGAALLGLGDADGAERAFLVAGQMGWRTPLTQYYWMQQAVALGDFRVAALRLDAMLRQNPALVTDSALLAPFESQSGGREAFVGMLATQPNWLSDYLANLEGVPPASVLVRQEILMALAGRTGPLGCRRIGTVVSVLVMRGAVLPADALWRRHCPEQAVGLVGDGDFRVLDVQQPSSAFDWSVAGNSDVSLSLADGRRAGTRQLVLASTAPFTRSIVSRLIPLRPGRYVVSWRAEDGEGRDQGRIVASLSCHAGEAPGDPRPDAGSPAPGGRRAAIFDVDAACPARWLTFGIAPGPGEVRLGEIAIEPAG